MSKFDKFNYIAELSLSYEDSPSSSQSEIFYNGRNQVAVTVTVSLCDKEGEALPLEEEDLQGLIYFCNPTKSETIPTSQMKVSDKPGEFVKAINYPKNLEISQDLEKNSKYVYVTKYISTENYINQEFSVGIDIPGYGKFDTSNKGTGVTLPSGSVFIRPKSLSLQSRNPIDYSNNNNLFIENNNISWRDLKVQSNNIHVKKGASDKYNGTSSYSYITIRLKDDISIQKKEIKRIKATLPGMLNLAGYTNTIAGEEKFSDQGGSADIIMGHQGGDAYDTSLVFIDQPKFGVYSSVQNPYMTSFKGITFDKSGGAIVGYDISNDNSKHIYTAGESNNSIPRISDKYILIGLSNHTVHLSKLSRRGWQNTPLDNGASFIIYDIFGNKGDITIKLTNESWPNFIINNVDPR